MAEQTISVVESRAPRYFTATDLPHTDAIRLAQRLFDNQGGNQYPPVITTEHPHKILKKSSKLVAKIRNRGARVEVLIADFFQFLVYYGALIETNDPKRKYVFDKDRFWELCLVHRTGVYSLKDYDRQERLLQLLGIEAEQPEAPGAIVETTSRQPVVDPNLLQPTEVRSFVTTAATDELNGLIGTYPELTELAPLLGLLAVHSAKGQAEGIERTLSDLVVLLHAFRDKVDDDALRVIEDFKPTESPKASTTNPTQWIEEEIRRLSAIKEPLRARDAFLSKLRAEAGDELEQLQVQVIEQTLGERLEVVRRSSSTKHEEPQLKAALERAEAAASTLSDYIDHLADIQRPIRAQLEAIQRRVLALRLVGQQLELAELDEDELPVKPFIDLPSLENWQTAIVTGAQVNEEAQKAEEPEKETANSTQQVESLPSIELNEKFVLALFRMTGQRTTLRLANALRQLELITREQVGVMFKTAAALSNPERPHRPLLFMGSFHGQATYRAAQHVPRSLVDEVLSKDLQQAVLDILGMKEPKP